MRKRVFIAGSIFVLSLLIGCNSKTENIVNENESVEDVEIVSEIASEIVVEKTSEVIVEEKSEVESEEVIEEPDELLIDEEHFPDKTLREYISKKYDKDKDGILSDEEANSVTDIGFVPDSFGGPPEIDLDEITDFKGIEYFPNLVNLSCMKYSGKTVDVSNNTKLEYFGIQSGNLESIDISNNTNLWYLGVIGTKVKVLDCSKNAKLIQVDAMDSSLESIDLSNNPNLQYLRVYNSKITRLDVSKCKTLLDQIARGRREELNNEYVQRISYITDDLGAFLETDLGVEIITE